MFPIGWIVCGQFGRSFNCSAIALSNGDPYCVAGFERTFDPIVTVVDIEDQVLGIKRLVEDDLSIVYHVNEADIAVAAPGDVGIGGQEIACAVGGDFPEAIEPVAVNFNRSFEPTTNLAEDLISGRVHIDIQIRDGNHNGL